MLHGKLNMNLYSEEKKPKIRQRMKMKEKEFYEDMEDEGMHLVKQLLPLGGS